MTEPSPATNRSPSDPATAEDADRSRRRTRRAWRSLVRWGSTGLASLCVLAGVGNLWAWLGIETRDYALNVAHGTISLERRDDWGELSDNATVIGGVIGIEWTWLGNLPGYDFGSRPGFFEWRPHAGTVVTSLGWTRRWYVDVPLWIPGVVCAGFALAAWRGHWQRQRSGGCDNCGYDLTGLASGARCPECGCV